MLTKRADTATFDPARFVRAGVVAFVAYIVLLAVLPLHAVSPYDGDLAGAICLGAVIWMARLAMAHQGADGIVARCLTTCRRAPIAIRISTSILLVLVALSYDRFLDGDPSTYRFASFAVPIIVSIVLFDLAAAAFAIAASALAIDYFLIYPIYEFRITTVSDALDLAIYILVSGQIALNIDAFINSGKWERCA